jgi:very-short-patch-repair endonuclease
VREIHSSSEVREYDIKREIDLKDHGFEFLRFTNEEVELRVNNVVGKIKAFINEKYNSVR